MPDTPLIRTRRALKSPKAAAIAGIIFAVLYGGILVTLFQALPPYDVSSVTWLKSNSGSISLALSLVPFAGIAFLWFIGVIRDHLGDQEDRLFSTVFLGSGLLFLGLTFVGSAVTGGLLDILTTESGILEFTSFYTFSRAVVYQILNIYALRMAGIFMISLAAIWIRSGVMHRVWGILTLCLALVLLLSVSFSLWITLIFPAWVLVISTYFLIRNLPKQVPEGDAEERAP